MIGNDYENSLILAMTTTKIKEKILKIIIKLERKKLK